MNEKVFDTFKEANEYAKLLVRNGSKGVRLTHLEGKFKVIGIVPEHSLQTHTPEPHNLTTNHPDHYEDTDRLCVDCYKAIPEERLSIAPNTIRCVSCQSNYEKTHDTRPRINEGIAGTREENKKMRGQVWGEIRNRGS